MKTISQTIELNELDIKAAICHWLEYYHDVDECDVQLKVEHRAPSISDNLNSLEEIPVFSATITKK
jgi:hypothetical protein